MNNYGIKENDIALDTQVGRFLTFLIGDVTYGIEMYYIREIVCLQEISEMPDMPDYIKGIINLRGVIIPVIDVRVRFGKSQRAYDDRTCVIVVEFSGRSVGLVVDSVSEVLSINPVDILETPFVNAGQASRFIKNIGKTSGSVLLIVDCSRLLGESVFETLSDGTSITIANK